MVTEALQRHGYRDLVRVGAGGLGDVYRAVRVSTGGDVAIKVVREVGDREATDRRVRRELNALLKLKGHPNVIQIEELLDLPTGLALVMEFAGHGSLMDMLEADGRLSPSRAVAAMMDVTRAIADAHALGIVHRDVKPHNVMIGQFGQCKVCDFGIAAVLKDAGYTDRTSALSYRYASPEEIDDADDIGPATDIYSLGVTLRQLLTLETNEARARQIIDDRGHDERLPIAERAAMSGLGQLIDSMTDRNAAARPPASKVLDVVRELDRELGAHRSVSLLKAGDGVVPTAADDDATVVRVPQMMVEVPETVVRPAGSKPLAPLTALDTKIDDVEARESSSSKRRPLWLKLAAAGVVAAVAIGAFVALTRGSPSAAEFVSLQPTAVLASNSYQHSVASIAFSGDGSQFVTSGYDETVRVWDTITGDAVRTIDGEYGTLNPQGTVLATSDFSERSTTLWDLASGAQLHTFDGYLPTFSGDGQVVATYQGESALVWSIAAGKQMSGVPGVDYVLQLSSDGSLLVTVDYSTSMITVWQTGDGGQILTVAGSDAVLGPTGTLVALDQEASELVVWDIATGTSLLTVPGYDYAVSADASRLAVSDGQVTTVWESATWQQLSTVVGDGLELAADGSPMISTVENVAVMWDPESGSALFELEGASYFSSFSPDGLSVTTVVPAEAAGDEVRVWDVNTGAEVAAIVAQESMVAFSPDSSRVAVSSAASSMIALVDLVSGRRLDVVTGHTDPVRAAHFAPSGASLVTESQGGSFELWDLDAGASIAITPTDSFNGEVSPDGTKLAVTYDDNTVRVLDAATFEELLLLPGFRAWWSPDGSMLASTMDGDLMVRDPTSGQLLSATEELWPWDVAFSPNAEQLAVLGGEGTMVLASSTGETLYEVPGWFLEFDPQGDVFTVAVDDTIRLLRAADGVQLAELIGDIGRDSSFSPEGSLLLTVRADGAAESEVMIYDSSTGELRYSVPGEYAGFIPDSGWLLTVGSDDITVMRDADTGKERYRLRSSDVVFSPDGELLAGSAANGLVTVWDALSGEPLYELLGAGGEVSSIGFNADGSQVAVTSPNGTATVWSLGS